MTLYSQTWQGGTLIRVTRNSRYRKSCDSLIRHISGLKRNEHTHIHPRIPHLGNARPAKVRSLEKHHSKANNHLHVTSFYVDRHISLTMHARNLPKSHLHTPKSLLLSGCPVSCHSISRPLPWQYSAVLLASAPAPSRAMISPPNDRRARPHHQRPSGKCILATTTTACDADGMYSLQSHKARARSLWRSNMNQYSHS